MNSRVHRFVGDNRSIAAGLWLAAGAVYLVTEAVAASAFSPSYSYALNYISDLGVPECGRSLGGRAICSPLHDVMNAGFVIQGLLFLAAAVVAAGTLTSRIRYILVALAAVNCLGIGMVGIFHEAAPASGASTVKYHVIGAFLAIVAGNGTALMSSALSRDLGLPAFHRLASAVLPAIGIIALMMLIVAQARGMMTFLPDAIWERGSVYTITAWEMLTGLCLALARRRGGTITPPDRSA